MKDVPCVDTKLAAIRCLRFSSVAPFQPNLSLESFNTSRDTCIPLASVSSLRKWFFLFFFLSISVCCLTRRFRLNNGWMCSLVEVLNQRGHSA